MGDNSHIFMFRQRTSPHASRHSIHCGTLARTVAMFVPGLSHTVLSRCFSCCWLLDVATLKQLDDTNSPFEFVSYALCIIGWCWSLVAALLIGGCRQGLQDLARCSCGFLLRR